MLRAVRFTAFFGFVLESETRAALERMVHLVAGVSPERVAAELRAMVSRAGRRRAVELLAETGLAREILFELAPRDGADHRWHEAARIMDAFDEPDLPMALAVLAEDADDETVSRVASRLRLSNREAKRAEWLRAGAARLCEIGDPASRPWSEVQPWVAAENAPALADILRARAACGRGDPAVAAWLTAQVARPRNETDPPPLVTGDELLAAGVPAGRPVGAALARIRGLQLDGVIGTKAEAIAAAIRSS